MSKPRLAALATPDQYLPFIHEISDHRVAFKLFRVEIDTIQ